MFINCPYEWNEYLIDGKIRTFRADTPKEIIDKAKEINAKSLEYEGKPYFFFSEE